MDAEARLAELACKPVSSSMAALQEELVDVASALPDTSIALQAGSSEVKTLAIKDDSPLEIEFWPAAVISLAGMDVRSHTLESDCCMSVWTRSGTNAVGKVTFYFPVVAIGPSYDNTGISASMKPFN